jgi:hypothetical protein
MQIKNVFPSNIKILNWNYDSQIQLAAGVFKREEFHQGFENLTRPPLIGYYPPVGNPIVPEDQISVEKISMVHLNGLAGYYFDNRAGCILNLFLNNEPKNINEIIHKIKTDSDKKHTLLTFAWEKNTESEAILRNRINLAKALVRDTDVLVIIGYSFPFFNRAVDSEIFLSLKRGMKLRKIIYQDPYRNGEFLKKQFYLSNEVEIVHVTEVDNYHVPNEL